MIVLNAEEVRRALPMGECIAGMKRAFAAFSQGRAEVPLRSRLDIPPHDALALFMPAYVNHPQGDALAVKVVSLYPHNPERGLAYIHAAVLVFAAESGQALALLEGGSLTAIRTGAASGAATDALARPESSRVAILGAGVQGRTQLEAVCTVRPIHSAWIYDSLPEKIEAFINEMAGKGPIPRDLRPAKDARQAISQADIVCCATTSHQAVFSDTDLLPGVHVNAIGAYTPEMQEVPAETIARALLVVDSRGAALAEAGDVLQAIQQSRITAEHIHAEIGEILAGAAAGRSSPEQVTVFKSVGIAVQDAVAAQLALENASKLHIGKEIAW
ncbi:MAG: hypothetical protein PHS96_12980 [Anaerolineales bacterium]|nr:hypothetical protein [Anaerolineales bacterium]